MITPEVSVVIPAYNEEERVGITVLALKKIPYIKEIIVVDDGSEDNTADRAEKAGAKVLRLSNNSGKGQALQEGLKLTTGEIIAFIDADLGETGCEISLLISPVLKGKTDMSVACFPPPKKRGGIGLVKGLASWGIKRYTGYRLRAPLSGQRVIRRDILDQQELSSGFGVEVGLTLDCLCHGYKILEVPINLKHRETGRNVSGFLHRGRQFWAILEVLWKKRKYRMKKTCSS